MKKILVQALVFTVFITKLFAYQWLAPNNDVMTSSFAEFRVAHFHGGIDLRAIEGSPVIAPADGWVQKVSVSPFGYGRAMYFIFDDSLTLVLGHLSRYPQGVEIATVKEQYEKKSHNIEKWFLKNEFSFKKGETIAFSGETGIGKPHIHFETKRKKDIYVSPHLYGFVPPDVAKPTIEAVAIVPLSQNAWVEESSAPQLLLPKDAAWNGKTLRVWGEICLGVDFYDKTAEANANRLGVRKVQMFLDSVKVFGCVYDSFSAEETVDIGYLYDGGLEALFGRRFHKLFVPGGTKLTLFELPTPAQGIIDASKLTPGEHQLRIYIEDFIGNSTELKLKLIAAQPERAELEIVGDKKNKKLVLKTPPLNTVLEYCPKGKSTFSKIGENVSEVRIDTLNGAFRARGSDNRQILPNYISTFAPTEFKSDKCSLFVCGRFLYYLVELDVPPATVPDFAIKDINIDYEMLTPRKWLLRHSSSQLEGYLMPRVQIFLGDPDFPYAVLGEFNPTMCLLANWTESSGESQLWRASLQIPGGALNEGTAVYNWVENTSGEGVVSPLFNFLPDWLYFRETARLVFEPTAANSLPAESLANVCVVRWWADRWYYVDTERKGRQITAKVRSLGAFALKRDDKSPWANFISASRDAIVFEVRDDFSGFGLGNLPTAYVDDDWTLAEYDPEAATIAIKGKKRFSSGKHFVKIVLEDRAKNKFEKTYEITIK